MSVAVQGRFRLFVPSSRAPHLPVSDKCCARRKGMTLAQQDNLCWCTLHANARFAYCSTVSAKYTGSWVVLWPDYFPNAEGKIVWSMAYSVFRSKCQDSGTSCFMRVTSRTAINARTSVMLVCVSNWRCEIPELEMSTKIVLVSLRLIEVSWSC